MVDFKSGDVGRIKINSFIVKDTTAQIGVFAKKFVKKLPQKRFTIFINGARYVVERSVQTYQYETAKEIKERFYSEKVIIVRYYPPTDETVNYRMSIQYLEKKDSFDFKVL